VEGKLQVRREGSKIHQNKKPNSQSKDEHISNPSLENYNECTAKSQVVANPLFHPSEQY
jgi:hypothetical protein